MPCNFLHERLALLHLMGPRSASSRPSVDAPETPPVDPDPLARHRRAASPARDLPEGSGGAEDVQQPVDAQCVGRPGARRHGPRRRAVPRTLRQSRCPDPAGRGRVDGEGDSREAASDGHAKRITSRLATVITRARWKRGGSRLSLDKRARAMDAGEAPSGSAAAIEQREASLRSTSRPPDTSSWMLDLPFGRRLSDDDALLVNDEQAARLAGG